MPSPKLIPASPSGVALSMIITVCDVLINPFGTRFQFYIKISIEKSYEVLTGSKKAFDSGWKLRWPLDCCTSGSQTLSKCVHSLAGVLGWWLRFGFLWGWIRILNGSNTFTKISFFVCFMAKLRLQIIIRIFILFLGQIYRVVSDTHDSFTASFTDGPAFPSVWCPRPSGNQIGFDGEGSTVYLGVTITLLKHGCWCCYCYCYWNKCSIIVKSTSILIEFVLFFFVFHKGSPSVQRQPWWGHPSRGGGARVGNHETLQHRSYVTRVYFSRDARNPCAGGERQGREGGRKEWL